jgi:predicted phage-related endonuclease
VQKLLKNIFNLKTESFLEKILMHAGITSTEFINKIKEIINKFNNLKKKIENNLDFSPKIVVFIDELNTSSILGYVKEVFVVSIFL